MEFYAVKHEIKQENLQSEVQGNAGTCSPAGGPVYRTGSPAAGGVYSCVKEEEDSLQYIGLDQSEIQDLAVNSQVKAEIKIEEHLQVISHLLISEVFILKNFPPPSPGGSKMIFDHGRGLSEKGFL